MAHTNSHILHPEQSSGMTGSRFDMRLPPQYVFVQQNGSIFQIEGMADTFEEGGEISQA
jgi:hypothetical protein